MEIENRIRSFLEQRVLGGKRKIADDDSLLALGIVDSLEQMRIVVFLEKEFQLTLGRGEFLLENFDSVNRIAALVRSRRAPSR